MSSCGRIVDNDYRAVVWDILPIPRHAVLGAIKQRRVQQVVDILLPGPVWQIAGVATLFTQGLFERPDVEPVPSEKIALFCQFVSSGCNLGPHFLR